MPRQTASRLLPVLLLLCTVAARAQSPGTPAQTPRQGTATTAPLSPDLPELLRNAAQALQENRLADAQAALEAARARDASPIELWAMFADLHARQGNDAAALADYRRALELHPGFFTLYRSIALLQIRLRHLEDAAATLRTWAQAEPANPRPVAMLLGLQLQQGRPAEAVKTGEAALAHLPLDARTDPELAYSLGLADLQAGDPAKGAALLLPLLRTGDLSSENGAAYALADAGLDLPQAEAAERAVLERMNLISEGWSLSSNLQGLRQGTDALAAMWDTLGWILFKEGKLPEAASYLRPAWRNSPHAATGEHLGQVEAALGNHKAALADFQLALAADATLPAGSEDPGSAQIRVALQKRIAAEQAGGIQSGLTDPASALLALQTLRPGPAHATPASAAASADLRLLFVAGRIAQALPLAGRDKLPPATLALLQRASVAAFFPPDSAYVQLVHAGRLTCEKAACDLLLDPAPAAAARPVTAKPGPPPSPRP